MTKPKKNWLEWSWFAFSALLLCLLIGYLAQQAMTAGEEPPKISFEFLPPEARDGQFLVKVIAHNRGDITAEAVHVEVILTADGKEERARLVIEHLPRHGKREAYVTFMTDPRHGSLRAQAVGYQEA